MKIPYNFSLLQMINNPSDVLWFEKGHGPSRPISTFSHKPISTYNSGGCLVVGHVLPSRKLGSVRKSLLVADMSVPQLCSSFQFNSTSHLWHQILAPYLWCCCRPLRRPSPHRPLTAEGRELESRARRVAGCRPPSFWHVSSRPPTGPPSADPPG